LHDRSKDQVAKGLAFVDKLLAKDVGKGRLTGLQAKETRERISVVDSLEGMRDVDMVVEVRVLCFYVFVQTVIGAI
jgi:3-hydroxybutyryl-CoA dehydrogenase